MRLLRDLWQDETGATALEYGLIVALVSVMTISALTVMGSSLSSIFTSISDFLALPVA